MALRSTGQSSKRSSEPFSRSAAIVRPNPSKLAKTNATHNAPGATAALLSTRRSKAKLKITSTSRANNPIPVHICLLRSSQRRSFHRIAPTCARKVIKLHFHVNTQYAHHSMSQYDHSASAQAQDDGL